MKRIALIIGAVVVLAAAGWSALWFTGRSQIEARLDQEIARLNAEGFEIQHGERQIGGFPTGYEVTYRDVSITDPVGGVRYELPTLTGVATADDPDRVAFHFPPEFRIAIRFGETMREQYDELPEELGIEVEATNLVVETTGPSGSALEFDARADALLIISADEQTPLALAVELVGVEGALTVPRDPDLGTVSGRTTFDGLDYAISFVDPDGARTTTEGISEDVSLSGSSSLRTPEQWQALFAGGKTGEAEFTYQAGETVSQIKVQGSADSLDGTIIQRAGTAGGVVKIGDGRIELRGSSETNRYEVAPEAADAPINGGIDLASLEVVYIAPIAPAEQMTDFTMRLAMSGLEADDALWKLIDPEETLARDPAHLILEVAGTGRLVPPTADGVRTGPPVEVGNIQIVAADVAALGASAVAEGALEFIQPINLPQGTVTVRLQNALELAGKLAELGLLDPGTYQMATLMSALYTQPGATENELVAKVEFTLDGIMVNGLPVQ